MRVLKRWLYSQENYFRVHLSVYFGQTTRFVIREHAAIVCFVVKALSVLTLESVISESCRQRHFMCWHRECLVSYAAVTQADDHSSLLFET